MLQRLTPRTGETLLITPKPAYVASIFFSGLAQRDRPQVLRALPPRFWRLPWLSVFNATMAGRAVAPSAWYSALRDKPFPTLYGENRTAVTADVLEAGLILAFCILTFAFLLLIPGVRGGQKLNVLARVLVSLFMGTFILLCNFGQEWEYSKIQATTVYKAFSHHELQAEIEVKIGLRSVNITLRNETVHKEGQGDRVDYNERFTWAWEQGRMGFGPQAGHYNRDFRDAQVRGTPLPILWIAEYFTFDGEGIRFGRHYRTAGWYTHILLW